jgi:hypothetical protein
VDPRGHLDMVEKGKIPVPTAKRTRFLRLVARDYAKKKNVSEEV